MSPATGMARIRSKTKPTWRIVRMKDERLMGTNCHD
jgi:hypothetical protein